MLTILLYRLTLGTSLPESPSSKEPSVAVVLRNQDTALATLADSAAGTFLLLYSLQVIKLTEIEGQFLQGRGYKGLEARVGEDAPSVLEQGRSGIARGYQDDHR